MESDYLHEHFYRLSFPPSNFRRKAANPNDKPPNLGNWGFLSQGEQHTAHVMFQANRRHFVGFDENLISNRLPSFFLPALSDYYIQQYCSIAFGCSISRLSGRVEPRRAGRGWKASLMRRPGPPLCFFFFGWLGYSLPYLCTACWLREHVPSVATVFRPSSILIWILASGVYGVPSFQVARVQPWAK